MEEKMATTASLEERLRRIEVQNQVILNAVRKKKHNTVFGLDDENEERGNWCGLEDENEERGNWSGRFDFFLSCLGYAVGLGNVWRFPYLCYKNGGGAFFIPYVIMLVFVGMPIFFLELSLGQFTSSGPLTCWKYSPIFQGCIDNIALVANSADCFSQPGSYSKDDGACYNANGTIFALYDQNLAKKYGIERELPSAQYFERYVTRMEFSPGLQDLGPMQLKIVLCYLLAFALVALALSKSIKSSGKVVYFTATFPYLVLLILLIRGLMLDGHKEGIDFFIKPDLSRLSDSTIWKDAAVQIFFSLSASWGGLIALSSYNRFHNDAMRDAVLISVSNCLTSVFAGFVIFSYIGNLAHELGVPVDEVADGGPSLAFIIYPYAVTKLPAAPLWSILFFLMLITLGLDTEFALLETVVTGLLDKFPKLREWKFLTTAVSCSVLFLLGLTMTTEGGFYMLEVMDTYSGAWNILFIALCECISICYFYGIRRFLQDIETMLGRKVCGCMPYFIMKFWWAFNWCFATPGLVVFVMVFSWVKYTGMEGDKYTVWADVLGWFMSLPAIVAICGGVVYALCTSETPREAIQPTREWGPALTKHRALVAKYIPRYEVDPWGKEPSPEQMVSTQDVNLQIMNGK